MTHPLPSPSRVLIVMAHPDDGEFMCGATIARWAREGRDIQYCVMTNGDVGTTDPTMTSPRLAALRQQEQNEAARRLGVRHPVIFLNFGDAQLFHTLETRRAVTRLIRQLRPDIVVTQDPTTYWSGRSYINHPDHRAVGDITLAAIMPSAGTRLVFPELEAEGLQTHQVKELYLTNTNTPDRWVEVTQDDIQRHVEALRAHASQIKRDPAEWVELGMKEEAAEANKCGHDFTYAQGYKYFRFNA